MKKVKLSASLFIVFAGLTIAGPSFGQQKQPPINRSLEVKMPVSGPVIASNYLNTITTTGADGTRYRLIVTGDVLPRLYVNNKQIGNAELAKYSQIIEKLTPILLQRQKQAN